MFPRILPTGFSFAVGLALAFPPPELLAGSIVSVAHFRGMCDASALIPLDDRHVVVADDEDNTLRIYNLEAPGAPVRSLDLSSFLRVDPREPEVDLEAAARVGNRIYWISSHGRNRSGRFRPSRHRFFATAIHPDQSTPALEPVGIPYHRLLVDLLADPRLAPFQLARAATLPPKSPGALNIEGLAALPDGRLLLGFRNPQPHGLALLVPLDNPDDVIAGVHARFGNPILLDLDHRGIRGIGVANSQDLILIAGSHSDADTSHLFLWSPGSTQTRPLPRIPPTVPDLNPESVEPADIPGSVAWFIASDDGQRRIGRRACKQLKNPAQKEFRVVTYLPQ